MNRALNSASRYREFATPTDSWQRDTATTESCALFSVGLQADSRGERSDCSRKKNCRQEFRLLCEFRRFEILRAQQTSSWVDGRVVRGAGVYFIPIPRSSPRFVRACRRFERGGGLHGGSKHVCGRPPSLSFLTLTSSSCHPLSSFPPSSLIDLSQLLGGPYIRQPSPKSILPPTAHHVRCWCKKSPRLPACWTAADLVVVRTGSLSSPRDSRWES